MRRGSNRFSGNTEKNVRKEETAIGVWLSSGNGDNGEGEIGGDGTLGTGRCQGLELKNIKALVGRRAENLNLKKRKMASGSHASYQERRRGTGVKSWPWAYELEKRDTEVRAETQWQFNCCDATVASYWTAKIVSIKTQTELIQATRDLAEKGQEGWVKEAVCPVVQSPNTFRISTTSQLKIPARAPQAALTDQ